MFRISRPFLSALLLCALASVAAAQSAVDSRAALSRFPDSQAVIFINANRIINDTMPRVVPAEQYQKLIEQGRQVGLDVRGLEYAAIGVRFAPGAPPEALPEFVGVVRGGFNADSVISLARLALGAKDKTAFREEAHGARTLLVLDMKKVTGPGGGGGTGEGSGAGSDGGGPKGFPFPEVALVSLDANTLAVGIPSYVRAAIDSSGGQGGLRAATLDLATRDPQALWSLTADLPENLPQYLQKAGMPPNEELNRILSWLKSFSFSMGMDAANFTTRAAVMTDSPEHAATLEGMLKMGLGMAEGVLRTEAAKTSKADEAEKMRAVLAALQNLTHAVRGNTLEVGVTVPQATIIDLVRKEMARSTKSGSGTGAGTGEKPKGTRPAPARRRQPRRRT
jgi:hypothetical protein